MSPMTNPKPLESDYEYDDEHEGWCSERKTSGIWSNFYFQWFFYSTGLMEGTAVIWGAVYLAPYFINLFMAGIHLINLSPLSIGIGIAVLVNVVLGYLAAKD